MKNQTRLLIQFVSDNPFGGQLEEMAVFAPAKLPENVTTVLTNQVQKIASSAAFKEKLGNVGVQPNTNFKESLSNFQTREIAKWAIAVRDSGASLD